MLPPLPIAHTSRAKEFLEPGNPYNIGMTGIIGTEAGYKAILECDTLLLLGADFAWRQFYPDKAKMKAFAAYLPPNDPNAMALATVDAAGLPRREDGIRVALVHDVAPLGPEWQRLGWLHDR